MNAILDTNALIDGIDLAKYDKVYVCIDVVEELDNLKTNKNYELANSAKQAIKSLKNATNLEIRFSYSCTISLDSSITDNRIIAYAKDVTTFDKDCVFVTADHNVVLKSQHLGIPCEYFESIRTQGNVFKGYQALQGGTCFINDFFDDIGRGINTYNFLINEYLILYNSDTDTVSEHRFDGARFTELKLPPSKVVKGLNSLQRCALDLLNNPHIPIKVIAGNYGSGKSLCAVKSGLYQVVNKENYQTLMFLRNPCVSDGAEIGFLPGSKQQKTEDFMKPFLQYVESDKDQAYAENLIASEKIKMDVVSFLKGVSLDDAFVIVDEAEDLNTKLIKLVGSRIGSNSCICFTGDWKQCEQKYKQDNGLVKIIQTMKGNPLVGIIVLEEDVRSSASKLFADL